MNGLILNGAASINSKEISDLVGLRHDNVKRTIETLVSQGVITSPQIEEKPTAGRPAAEYVFSGEQGKRDSIIVVAQLCPAFTARLVDRWQELERGSVYQRELSKMEILQLAMESEQGRLQAEAKATALEGVVAEQAPKAEFHDRVVAAPDAISMGDAAKILGTGRTRLMAMLRQMHWLTRHNEPYQEKIEAGLMDVKLSKTWEHPEQGLRRSVTPLLTGKGLARLQSQGVGQPPKGVAA